MAASTKPYLIRALYEWCLDNNQTPHIVAWVNEHTRVPMQYVRNGEIVLNIGVAASHNLTIDNEWINFSARFSGVAHDIWIPVGHITSIFARETGEGMGFELEPYTATENGHRPGNHTAPAEQEETAPPPKNNDGDKPPKPKKGLKLVK